MRRVALVLAALLVVGAGCSDDSHSAASTATSFTSGVCSSISMWATDLVDAANAFTEQSPHLSESGRRAQYLFAFDEQRRITDELRANLSEVPGVGITEADAVRAELLAAVDDIEAEIADRKAFAADHIDFSTLGPRPDRLFAGTEKSLSLMLKPLAELSRTEGIIELGGTCGRRNQ